MPRYQSIRSKKEVHGKDETGERGATETSSLSSETSHNRKSSKMKEMSTKAAKGVKRQLRRLDDFLHHVTHTKHDSTSSSSSSDPVANIRRRTLSVPSPPVSIAFERARTRSTWNTAKYAKEADRASSASESSYPLSTSVEIGIQTDILEEAEETQMAHREENPLQTEEHVETVPAVALPPIPSTVYVEAEVPDPFLDDEEGDAQDDENVASSVTVSPANIPLDLPSSPQQPLSAIPNLNKDVPPPPVEEQDEEEGEEEEGQQEEAPEIYLPALTLPTMFLPIPNVRLSFSFYFLTWWLRRHSIVRS